VEEKRSAATKTDFISRQHNLTLGQRPTAIITADAARELALQPGDSAFALIKATDVMIGRPKAHSRSVAPASRRLYARRLARREPNANFVILHRTPVRAFSMQLARRASEEPDSAFSNFGVLYAQPAT